MDCSTKVARLLNKLADIVDLLNDQSDFRIHLHVDKYFFIQKTTELQLLTARLIELSNEVKDVEDMLSTCYATSFARWKKDYRWLTHYLQQVRQNCDPA